MNFYIDFEATQPEQEIISIGIVAGNGETFHSLIKPQFSSISKYISDMTGITPEIANKANSFDTVMSQVWHWCRKQEDDITLWNMYVYGDSDVGFLKTSLPNAKSEAAILITSIMIATIKDYSIEVAKYFHGTTSLIKAFNYLKSLEDKQKHNALEDAKMLAEVYNKTLCAEPLEANPFTTTPTECSFNFPTGRFFCKSTGKNAKEREFANIHDAMEWIIEHKIGQKDRPNIRRDKMAVKIMVAIKKKKTYMQYNWRRVKD